MVLLVYVLTVWVTLDPKLSRFVFILDRFTIRNGHTGAEVRHRMSKEHYSNFYREVLSETLAACVYNEGPRKQKKGRTQPMLQHVHQQATQTDQQTTGVTVIQSTSTRTNHEAN